MGLADCARFCPLSDIALPDLTCRRCASVPRDTAASAAFEATLPMPDAVCCRSWQELNIAIRWCEWKAECNSSRRTVCIRNGRFRTDLHGSASPSKGNNTLYDQGWRSVLPHVKRVVLHVHSNDLTAASGGCKYQLALFAIGRGRPVARRLDRGETASQQ